MEEALAAERNLLRTMVDNIPDFIYVKDTDCRMVFDNIAHAVALGAGHPDEVVGKTDFDFFPEEAARAYNEADQEALESGQVIRGEEVYTDPTGDERWLLTTRVPLRDPEEKVMGIVGVSHDVTNSLQPQIEQKGQELALETDSDLPHVWADADRVTLILTNLLSNAHKYTPEGGRITVKAYREDSMVRVDVKDTGIGMTPEEKSKLFTKFFRSDNLVIR